MSIFGGDGPSYTVDIIAFCVGDNAPAGGQRQCGAALQFITQGCFCDRGYHGADFAADVLECGQSGGGGEGRYVGNCGRSLL